jgi:hypothetical protein
VAQAIKIFAIFVLLFWRGALAILPYQNQIKYRPVLSLKNIWWNSWLFAMAPLLEPSAAFLLLSPLAS